MMLERLREIISALQNNGWRRWACVWIKSRLESLFKFRAGRALRRAEGGRDRVWHDCDDVAAGATPPVITSESASARSASKRKRGTAGLKTSKNGMQRPMRSRAASTENVTEDTTRRSPGEETAAISKSNFQGGKNTPHRSTPKDGDTPRAATKKNSSYKKNGKRAGNKYVEWKKELQDHPAAQELLAAFDAFQANPDIKPTKMEPPLLHALPGTPYGYQGEEEREDHTAPVRVKDDVKEGLARGVSRRSSMITFCMETKAGRVLEEKCERCTEIQGVHDDEGDGKVCQCIFPPKGWREIIIKAPGLKCMACFQAKVACKFPLKAGKDGGSVDSGEVASEEQHAETETPAHAIKRKKAQLLGPPSKAQKLSHPAQKTQPMPQLLQTPIAPGSGDTGLTYTQTNHWDVDIPSEY